MELRQEIEEFQFVIELKPSHKTPANGDKTRSTEITVTDAEKEENLYRKHRNINRTKTYYDWNTCWSDAPIQD